MIRWQTAANSRSVNFEIVLRAAVLLFEIEAHKCQIDGTSQVVWPLDDEPAEDVVRIVRRMVGRLQGGTSSRLVRSKALCRSRKPEITCI